MSRTPEIALLLLVCLLSACGRPGGHTAARDFAIPINLRCTTCDDFIRCTRQGLQTNAATGRPDSTVYRLKEKTFWAQIATIADYLLQFARDKTVDERPLAIYRQTGGIRTIEHDRSWRAQIDILAARIMVPDHSIDQRTGAWYDAAGQNVGQCLALPRREGYALVREFLGKPALGGGGARQ
jgi:hypothetical protein